ncbi:uncharacterized protein LOC114250411 [Bombyx mandarina]|uniref:Uncharacterized protein LOC114250411 n=1 Tax=Bombyx mandarina TaxID=7092 RepID=A0A6J2KGK9_BOMMA|nr:uncharacterized protein LOC114250411 [Bombyx mandarina]
MSGYLDVKYPFRSNLGLNPFKSWKRQWCILRPSATSSGGSLAVYCNEAGAAVGCVELPSGCVVRRAKSRSRPHAFAVFSAREPNKPIVLLAASNIEDAQTWMDKIKNLLNDTRLLTSNTPLKDSYSVTVVATDLSRKCGLQDSDSTVTLSAHGMLITRTNSIGTFVEWKHMQEVLLCSENGQKSECLVSVNSKFHHGGGDLKFASPLACELVSALRAALHRKARLSAKLSKSEGDLRTAKCSDSDLGEIRRSSWYSGPSEVSLDDMDLIMSKDYKCIPSGQLSRCSAAGHLAQHAPLDHSACDRRSVASVSSGVYEEIPEPPALYCAMGRGPRAAPPLDMKKLSVDEPTYESIAECGYATLRRARGHPPPLPPRCLKTGEPWSARPQLVSRHSSLSALPGAPPHTLTHTLTLPRRDKHKQPFSVFRKRLKSDSRVAGSPKSETPKDNKDIQPKKKRFDFAPTRDILKSFKVSRKVKSQKAAPGLGHVETKSCEFLDETEHVATSRCSKSVECLEGNDEYLDDFEADLSIQFNEKAIEALSLPQEIVDLLLSIKECEVRLRDDESEYVPMTPAAPPPAMEHHYIVMSPKSNLA